MSEVTVAMLAYKSVAWIDYALEGLRGAKNITSFKTLVVGCDPEEAAVDSGLLDYTFRSANPGEYYINRVYRAWNAAVQRADTPYVVLMNSDMYVSDFWLDSLMLTLKYHDKCVPCSLLVESGRIKSAMPEHVKYFGVTPEAFDRQAWHRHAESIRSMGNEEHGRLFMPALFHRCEFLDLGGYPPGNPDGVSGDRVLFNKYEKAGFTHLTSLGSVVYHVQEGEMRG